MRSLLLGWGRCLCSSVPFASLTYMYETMLLSSTVGTYKLQLYGLSWTQNSLIIQQAERHRSLSSVMISSPTLSLRVEEVDA